MCRGFFLYLPLGVAAGRLSIILIMGTAERGKEEVPMGIGTSFYLDNYC